MTKWVILVKTRSGLVAPYGPFKSKLEGDRYFNENLNEKLPFGITYEIVVLHPGD